MTSADMASSTNGNGSRAHRRVFTREYKLRIVAEYDGASEHGARGALLRREGLYESHIGKWRRARDEGRLGPNGGRPHTGSLERENARLRAELAKTTAELESTKAVVEIMGKVQGLLQTISDRAEPPTT